MNAKRLDDILKELKIDVVNFMKLDIEEAEPEALRGSRELLKGNKLRKILFECINETSMKECKSILEQYGYSTEYAGLSYYLAEPRLL